MYCVHPMEACCSRTLSTCSLLPHCVHPAVAALCQHVDTVCIQWRPAVAAHCHGSAVATLCQHVVCCHTVHTMEACCSHTLSTCSLLPHCVHTMEACCSRTLSTCSLLPHCVHTMEACFLNVLRMEWSVTIGKGGGK